MTDPAVAILLVGLGALAFGTGCFFLASLVLSQLDRRRDVRRYAKMRRSNGGAADQ